MDEKFYPYLYNYHDVPEMLKRFCEDIFDDPNSTRLQVYKAQKLTTYCSTLEDTTVNSTTSKIKERLNDFFGVTTAKVIQEHPSLSNRYSVPGRIKGLISTLNKFQEIEDNLITRLCNEFLKSQFNDEEEINTEREKIFKANSRLNKEFLEFVKDYKFKDNPFNRIKDFIGLSYILEDSYCSEFINELYEVANIILETIVNNSFKIEQPTTPVQTGMKENPYPDLIYVPSKSGISKEYCKHVKDYVYNPKENGYQAIHIVIYDYYTERYFELQLKTRSMWIVADSLAEHTQYKESKYGKQIKKVHDIIDYTKISVPGFRYHLINGKPYIFDEAGITKHIPLILNI